MERYTNHVVHDEVDVTLTCRVTVYFCRVDSEPGMVLEYLATWPEAAEFAAAAGHLGLLVTVDDHIRPGLRQLPCRSLWR